MKSRERTELAKGQFDIESTTGKKTILTASWPMYHV
jgi:signal transduction histidine kinase